MRLLTPIVAVVVLLSLGACAQVKQSDSRPSGTAHEGSTVVVGPKEAGRNVTLHQGDRLVVVAGAKRRGRQWMLASFPRSLLNLRSSYLPRGRFEFLAAHTGHGRLALRHVLTCDRCPVKEHSQKEGQSPRFQRSWIVVIKISVI